DMTRSAQAVLPRSHLPQRLRPQPAGRRPGGHVPDPAPGQRGAVPGPVQTHRRPLPPGSRGLCPGAGHPPAAPQAARPHPLGLSQARPRPPHLEQAEREGRCGVVAIVAAQEVQKVFMGYQRGKDTHGKAVNFGFDKADRAVTVYYFYVLDADFGPGFIKLCSYFPYPAKVWLNGHEWAKRQAAKAGLAVAELANGFAACDQRRACKGSAPASTRPRSRASSTAGSPRSPRPSPTPTVRPGGGSCPCARSR